MATADHDRKILWARAHNACAICKRPLVHEKTATDRESVVGDEAHIVSRRPGGPRAGLLPKSELDKYDNLILLCRVHHKIVDDQPHEYTRERLHRIRSDHERWASEKFEESAVPPVRLVPDPAFPKPIKLALLQNGAEVWDTIVESHSYRLASPSEEHATQEQCDLADRFLDLARDWGEASAEVVGKGLSAVREAKRSLGEELARLVQRGLVVYGARRRLILKGGVGPPSYWREAILEVIAVSGLDLGSHSGQDRPPSA